ncbi:MAG: hypothetical protein SWZ49_23625 [Cyanobacteriota bacterium]|nr:hypothetical protein [Cyanobacteriota bacterium]
MREVTFDTPVLKVEGLEVKFDVVTVSNSLVAVLGSSEEALIVQLIHSWTLDGQGVEIDGERWFNKSIKDWIAEALPTTSTWKMRSYMSSLVQKGVLSRKQLHKKHHGHNYSPKNRTYYYRLDYEGLSKLADLAIDSKNSNNAGGEE